MPARSTAPAPSQRQSTTHPLYALGMLVVTLTFCAATLKFTKAANPLALLDPGIVVRWGIPLNTSVGELTSTLTIGFFLLGGLLMPEGVKSARRMRTGRYGAWSALAWGIIGAIGVFLSYVDISGVHVGAPAFWAGALQSIWTLEVLQALTITAIIALVLALLAFSNPGRNGQAWLFFASIFALLPLALAGHASSASDHDAAINSLAFHLVGVAIWAGGLLALLLMWNHLGRSAADVIARFSRIATWCYIVVGFSGLLNAWIRVGDLDGVSTRYGMVVLVKFVALVILGVFGYLQRKYVVARLRADAGSVPPKTLFARLAGTEVLVMSIAIGLAAALARSEPPVPETPVSGADTALALTGYPTPPVLDMGQWFTAWRTEWLFTLVAIIAVGVYLTWTWRLHRRGDKWPWTRTTMWCLGWLIFLYMIDGAPGVYGRVMFSMHMLGHIVISMLVPILLVRSAAVTLALRALPRRRDKTLGPRELLLAAIHSKVFSIFANPILAAVFMLGTLIFFYYSPWFELALRTHAGHVLMVTHFMVSGYIYAWVLVGVDPGPKRWAPPVRMLVLIVTICFHSFFGVASMTGTTLLAPTFFEVLHLSYVPSPLLDQQRAGTVAWGAGELPTLILTMMLSVEWYRRDRAEGARAEWKADHNGNANLNAYNEYLANRAKAEANTESRIEKN